MASRDGIISNPNVIAASPPAPMEPLAFARMLVTDDPASFAKVDKVLSHRAPAWHVAPRHRTRRDICCEWSVAAGALRLGVQPSFNVSPPNLPALRASTATRIHPNLM